MTDLVVGASTRCSDRYTGVSPAGSVVGSAAADGTQRRGVDVEGRIGIDNGALRFRPLAAPGWGREAIAYGPFDPVPGLAFSALVLNGHNASQTFYFPESPADRARRFVAELLRVRPMRQHHYENMAVGFFDEPGTTEPLRAGPSFVMHSATEDNGELWGTHGGRPARIARGIQNLPFVYVVALRQQGAAFYLTSLPGAAGSGSYPMLRPVGIDPAPVPTPLFAGIQQRILGEVGYRVDTRIYGTEVAVVERWREWFGTAVAADRLTGAGEGIDAIAPDVGAVWQVDGDMTRTAAGAQPAAVGRPCVARSGVEAPVGLLHAVVHAGRSERTAELRWRIAGDGAHLAVILGTHRCEIVARDAAGSSRSLAADAGLTLRAGSVRAVQVLDDGTRVAVHVDGRLLGGTWPVVPAGCFDAGHDVGFVLSGDVAVRDFEAHPREIALPAVLDCGAPWTPPASGTPWHEWFDATSPDLDGTSTPSGGRRWTRVEGVGAVELRGDHARVRADRERPFPDRAVFTVPWDDPGHARLELDMTIPGQARGEGHNGRCGVVFWQDPENYLIVNVWVDDVFPGASISTFYHLDGHEDMYDAVWTLVRGVEWGRRCTLWATFDGERFLSGIDGEPCLVRALSDVYPGTPQLSIERVGLIVNEEWGNDTGTVLHRFSAAGGAA